MPALGSIGAASGDARTPVSAVAQNGTGYVAPAVVDASVGLQLPAPVAVSGAAGAGYATIARNAPNATLTGAS